VRQKNDVQLGRTCSTNRIFWHCIHYKT